MGHLLFCWYWCSTTQRRSHVELETQTSGKRAPSCWGWCIWWWHDAPAGAGVGKTSNWIQHCDEKALLLLRWSAARLMLPGTLSPEGAHRKKTGRSKSPVPPMALLSSTSIAKPNRKSTGQSKNVVRNFPILNITKTNTEGWFWCW